MSTLHREAPTRISHPTRPVLLGLSLVFLLGWVYFFVLTGPEIDEESSGATVLREFDAGQTAVSWGGDTRPRSSVPS
jgi:hypothetical protein